MRKSGSSLVDWIWYWKELTETWVGVVVVELAPEKGAHDAGCLDALQRELHVPD
jgi:hypothetical protein